MKNKFISAVKKSIDASALKKLVFSRPLKSEVSKVTARLVSHRSNVFLAFEYNLPGNTVSQKNVLLKDSEEELSVLISEYRQANLITALGDAEYKISASGKEAVLGADKILRRLSFETPEFEAAIDTLDRKKNYILSGDEKFLIKLGISDASGRVHDKKQGKFRQINRFLEHIESLYSKLPSEKITIYDLCSGKSYLSFAVYYYLTQIKKRELYMLAIDLKRDVITWCEALAKELSFSGMHFVCDDIRNTPRDTAPDMVISLHACDVATDIVLDTAIELKAKIILSTPCCHRYLNDKLKAEKLSFVYEHSHLRNKLCEALTDGIRTARLSASGYDVSCLELTDPENTPKNTLIKALISPALTKLELEERKKRYEEILSFVLGDGTENYLKEIK